MMNRILLDVLPIVFRYETALLAPKIIDVFKMRIIMSALCPKFIFITLTIFCFFFPFQKINAKSTNDFSQSSFHNYKQKTQKNQIVYLVTINNDDRRVAHVECRFSASVSSLSMNNNLAQQLPNGYAEFVKNLQLTDSKGNVVSIKNSGVAKWDLENTSSLPKILRYDVLLNHDQIQWGAGPDEAPYLRPDNIFWTGRALFIIPNQKKQINVQFNLPNDWIVSSPWEKVSGQSRVFKVEDNEELTNSFLLIGSHHEHLIKVKNLEMRLAIGKQLNESELLIKDSVEKLLRQYADLFGDTPKERILLVMNSQNRECSLDGGVFGKSISTLMGIKPSKENMGSWISFVAHETFHLWNGEFIQAKNQEYWFSEGFTEYYADLISVRLKFISQQEFINNLEFAYKLYFEQLGKTSLRAAGARKFQFQSLIYQGGRLIGLALDLQIRKITNNKRNLDDLMRELNKNYGKTRRKYSIEDIITTANKVAQTDFRPFFIKYVENTETLPMETYLKHCGLELINRGYLPSSNYAVIKLLRINSLTHSGMIIRDSVHAGYRDGDSLVAINGTAIKNIRDIQEICQNLTPGSKAQITVIRNNQPVTFTVEMGNDPIEKSLDISIIRNIQAVETEKLILSTLLNL